MLVRSVRVFHLVRAIHEVCAVGTGPEQLYGGYQLFRPISASTWHALKSWYYK